jgi:hypothetical protein
MRVTESVEGGVWLQLLAKGRKDKRNNGAGSKAKAPIFYILVYYSFGC